MRYYKLINGDTIITIGTGAGGIEITETEYNTFRSEICAKADLVDKLYNGEITIADVPEAWKEEIKRRVDERKARDEVSETEEISDEEALAIITGGAS